MGASRRSEAVGGLGHHLGHQAHAVFDRRGEAPATGRQGVLGVLLFVAAHLFQHRAGLGVCCRQLVQVLVQMAADLILGSRDEAQAQAIADQAGTGADPEGEAIEQRIEQARTLTQGADALLAPGQVIDLFVGRLLHFFAHFRQLGGQRLTLVQRLGADLAGVVDAHEAGRMTAFLVAQLGVLERNGRRAAGGSAAEGRKGTQGGIRLDQQSIEGGVEALGSQGDIHGGRREDRVWLSPEAKSSAACPAHAYGCDRPSGHPGRCNSSPRGSLPRNPAPAPDAER